MQCSDGHHHTNHTVVRVPAIPDGWYSHRYRSADPAGDLRFRQPEHPLPTPAGRMASKAMSICC